LAPSLKSFSRKTSASRRASTFPISEKTLFTIGLPFIATLHIRQIAWRILNDYAPDRRAAKRPDEFELVIVAAVLLESSVKLILCALARAPIHLPERQFISTYRWNKLSARWPLATEHRRVDDV
jgi:hypothetical protein